MHCSCSLFQHRSIWVLLFLLELTAPICLVGQAAVPESIDVVIVLDNSKSMRTNDPQRLMIPALREFVRHLPETTNVGVIVFGREARTALALEAKSSSEFAKNFADGLKKIDYTDQWTDIAGGIERGVYEIRSGGRRGKAIRRAIILFTDGAIDLGSPEANKERTAWLHGTVTAEAVQESVSVFGIAFTYTADFQLIQTLSVNTKGLPFLIDKPARIDPVFADIAVALASPHDASEPKAQPYQHDPPTSSSGWVYVAIGCILTVLAVGAFSLYARLSSPYESATITEVGRMSQTYPISGRVFRVGRKPRVGLRRIDLVIPDKERRMVSRLHAEIRYRRGQFYLCDNHSLHGTSVSEGASTRLRKLKPGEAVLLSDGAHIAFHAYEYVFGSTAPDLRLGESDRTNREGGTTPQNLAQCQYCDGHFDPASLAKWTRFTVCSDCRAKIHELDDAAANRLMKEMEDRLRNKTTDRT